MKLPLQIKTRNKIRDAQICKLWVENKLTNEEIADKIGISERHVGRIVYANRHVLELDKDYEKKKRIRWLKRQIEKRGGSKKDSADLLEQLRTEIEGEKAQVQINQYTQIWNTACEKSERIDQSGRLIES
jgi:hypothetical protein